MIEEFRRFIRHPSSIPISFRLGKRRHRKMTKDVSEGGLCFSSRNAVEEGETILLEIDACQPAFCAEGIVRWCQEEGRHFLIGVAFSDKTVRYAMRMVEQICHIEAYRRRLEAETGEAITSQQAAFRWIAEQAGSFPQTD